MEELDIDQIHDESIYEVHEKDQDNKRLVKTKELMGQIEFDKVYQTTLFLSLIFHVSIFLWMLLLSLRPQPGKELELDEGYSVLAAVSMICYITGLFALYWKSCKCQRVFLFFLGAIIIANIVLVLLFKKEENVEYVTVAIFLTMLNSILAYKAVTVYKKMKGK